VRRVARVVVVGGGLGGMACAARLARLGHAVTLLEAGGRLGGALGTDESGGFGWDTGPASTLLPAVLRDLFRKTGRPLERELALVPLDPLREHRFADGSVVRMPGGSRAAQLRAVEELGPGLGHEWVRYVDGLAEDWDVMRRSYFERPWHPLTGSSAAAARLRSRRHLGTRLHRGLPDRRLRSLAAHPFPARGEDPRHVPAWMGLGPYLEQRFGGWTAPNGLARVAEALEARLALRGVEVLRHTPGRDLVLRGGRVVAVATEDDQVSAEVVVCAVDPRLLPALASYVTRSEPAPVPSMSHLGLATDRAAPVPEIVLHGDPVLTVRTTGRAPDGYAAWTLLGHTTEDLVTLAAARGLDVRDRIVARVDRSPAELLDRWGQSPWGSRWRGRSTVRHRLGPDTPVAGVYAAGAHAAPGAGVPFVGLSAALVAAAVGPA
jgi:UDP-galactopyranose mutase